MRAEADPEDLGQGELDACAGRKEDADHADAGPGPGFDVLDVVDG